MWILTCSLLICSDWSGCLFPESEAIPTSFQPWRLHIWGYPPPMGWQLIHVNGIQWRKWWSSPHLDVPLEFIILCEWIRMEYVAPTSWSIAIWQMTMQSSTFHQLCLAKSVFCQWSKANLVQITVSLIMRRESFKRRDIFWPVLGTAFCKLQDLLYNLFVFSISTG